MAQRAVSIQDAGAKLGASCRSGIRCPQPPRKNLNIPRFRVLSLGQASGCGITFILLLNPPQPCLEILVDYVDNKLQWVLYFTKPIQTAINGISGRVFTQPPPPSRNSASTSSSWRSPGFGRRCAGGLGGKKETATDIASNRYCQNDENTKNHHCNHNSLFIRKD